GARAIGGGRDAAPPQPLWQRSDAHPCRFLAGRAAIAPAGSRDSRGCAGAAAARPGRCRCPAGHIAARGGTGAFKRCAGHAGQAWRPPPLPPRGYRPAAAHNSGDRVMLALLSFVLMAQVGAAAPPTLEQDRLTVCLDQARTDRATAIVMADEWLAG